MIAVVNRMTQFIINLIFINICEVESGYYKAAILLREGLTSMHGSNNLGVQNTH